ncbi:MAG: hypothetical protein AABY86_03585, partial [Bdellovibrionota bacterium]
NTSETVSPGSSVRVYATANPERGLCVQGINNLTQACLEASRDNLDDIVRDMTTEKYTRLNATIAQFCNGSHRNTACQHLEDRINEIRIAALPPKKKCKVVSDSGSTSEAGCRSVVVRCRQGNVTYQGYLPNSGTSALTTNLTPGADITVAGAVSRDRCGNGAGMPETPDRLGSPDRAFLDQCTSLTRVTDIMHDLSNHSTSSDCADERVCFAQTNCLAGTNASTDSNVTYELTMACICRILEDE